MKRTGAFWRKFIAGALTTATVISATFLGYTAKATNENVDWSKAFEIKAEASSLNAGDMVRVKFYVHDVENFTCFDSYLILPDGVFEDANDNSLIVNESLYSPEDGYSIEWTKHVTLDERKTNIINSFTDETTEPSDEVTQRFLNGLSASYYNNTVSDLYRVSIVGLSGNSHGHKLPSDGCAAWLDLELKQNVDAAIIEAFPLEITWKSTEDGNTIYGAKDATDDGEVFLSRATLTAPTPTNAVTLATENVTAAPGKTFSVPLSIGSNSGFNAIRIDAAYDATVCRFTDLTLAEGIRDKVQLQSIYEDADHPGEVHASFVALNDIADTGAFATLNFTANETAADNASTDISFTVQQVTNTAETTVTGSGAKATVTIKSEPQPTETVTLGDVNGDTKIDLTDAVYILQYYNNVRTLTETQTRAADVNKDGAVNLVDALHILQFYNGERKTL